MADMPIYVKVEEYRDVLDVLSMIKNKLHEAEQTLDKINDLKNEGLCKRKVDMEPETLRTQLQIEWRDHFQTRNQSWRTVQIVIALLLGMIGADIQFNQIWITTIIGVFLFLGNFSGFAVT
ncbi:MAG: hypothetical protein IH795_08245, partial [Bacteroidetes bacterium]|nr:hypothetical protein [Bacteroidota bacterium]